MTATPRDEEATRMPRGSLNHKIGSQSNLDWGPGTHSNWQNRLILGEYELGSLSR